MMIDQAPNQSGPQDFEWTLPPFAHGRMYAISLDMDLELLRRHYSQPLSQAYADIKRILRGHGFKWQQRNLFFGDMDKVSAVTCVLAAQDLARALPWFADAVRTMRMLRIEEQNNLLPTVRQASETADMEGLCLASAGPIPFRKFPPSPPSDQITEI